MSTGSLRTEGWGVLVRGQLGQGPEGNLWTHMVTVVGDLKNYGQVQVLVRASW